MDNKLVLLIDYTVYQQETVVNRLKNLNQFISRNVISNIDYIEYYEFTDNCGIRFDVCFDLDFIQIEADNPYCAVTIFNMISSSLDIEDNTL
jgi:hypothetical protein